jgi:hypothetical protein
MRALIAAIVAVAIAGACDPVVSDEVASLGDNAPGVRNGPLHRPGQPCLVCHDGAIRNPSAFSVAGTVFANPSPDTTPASDVQVVLTDSNNAKFTATTNAAGNFYVTPTQFAPAYPMRVELNVGSTRVCMFTHVGRDGSCAGCHTDPLGPRSPGHVTTKPTPAMVVDCDSP